METWVFLRGEPYSFDHAQCAVLPLPAPKEQTCSTLHVFVPDPRPFVIMFTNLSCYILSFSHVGARYLSTAKCGHLVQKQ